MTASNQLTFGQLEAVWILAGGDPSYAPTMAGVAFAESGGEPNNTQKGQPYATTGWGLWQITPGNSESQVGTDAQLNDPLTNAKAAVAKFNAAAAAGENPMAPWTSDPVGQVAINQNGPLSLGQVITAMRAYSRTAAYTTNPAIISDASANPTTQWALNLVGNPLVDNPTGFFGQFGPDILGTTGVLPPGPDTPTGQVPTLNSATGLKLPSLSNLNPLNSVDALISWISSHGTRILEAIGGLLLIGVGLAVFFESTSTGQKITSDAAVAAAA